MNNISIKIGRWYEKNKRDLPWRQTKDAYRIWLSEIILLTSTMRHPSRARMRDY